MDEEAEYPLPEINANKVLVSVASLSDIDVHPLSSESGHLYRSDNVAIIFRSKTAMDRVVGLVIDQVKTNARIQRSSVSKLEVVRLTDPGHELGLEEIFNLP